MTLYTTMDRCRSCGSQQLAEALDLGLFHLADYLDKPDADSDRAPLVLVRCQDCTLVQLRHTVDRERLYRRYWYRSGLQPAMVSALADVVRDARGRVPLSAGDVALDIGANDGTLLRQYPADVVKLAYEPAINLYYDLEASGAQIAGTFFPNVIGGKPVGLKQKAKIITSIAMFYDVDDPNMFVEGIKACLAEDGVWICQMAYLPATLLANNFGDIVHEHLTYWSIGPFNTLLKRHGLTLLNWSHNDVNGGSIRLIVGHDTGQADVTSGWTDPVGLLALKKFGQRIRLQRSEVRDFLHRCKRDGKLVVGYGASTKGSTYLQYWGVGPDLLAAIADRNPEKAGKFTPTGQLVISEDEMRDEQPDYLLVLPFHFIDSFVQREADLLEHGTQFVVPFPNVHFVGGADAGREQVAVATAARPNEAA